MNGLQKLAKWIAENSSRADFARDAECSESHLCNVLNGKKEMSLALAKRFSKATSGAISLDELVAEAVE